ncbi:MAG: hypothetical protein ACI85O_001492 [Saprospiraceae bacterium]|jgi:hypothetical protein
MSKEILIDNTLKILTQLPRERVNEVNDFADFLLRKYEDEILTKGVHLINAESKSFDFLAEEEDLYSKEDVKEFYHE